MCFVHTAIGAFSNQPDVTVIPFLLTDCQCTGSESRVIDCSYTGGISQCLGGRVAYAQCGTCKLVYGYYAKGKPFIAKS